MWIEIGEAGFKNDTWAPLAFGDIRAPMRLAMGT